MIDIHSHILPGVDDGAQTMEESIQMAEAAVKEGITTIVATPHHDGTYSNFKHDIIIQVSELNRILRQKNIPLEVLPGQEPRISDELIEDVRNERILSINNAYSTFVFIEFPHDDVPHYASRLLFDLQVEGYQPIIVHPERNLKIQESPNILYSLINNGAFSQITAGSVTGDFGRTAKKTAMQLINANLAHLIASDAHNTKKRTYYMKKAYNTLEKEYGQSMVYYFMENAEYVIDGQALASDPPERVKKKKLLGLF